MTTPNELKMVAKLAAIHTIRGVREQITDLVQYETQKVLPAIHPEKIQPSASSNPLRYERSYVEPPAKSASNYADVLMSSARWRSGKGERLAIIWLEKPGTRESLLVEQYGDECAVLKRDESQPGAVLDQSGIVKVPGKSVWTQFNPMAGQIDQVAAKLLSKGWAVKQPTRKAVQLSLVEGMKGD